MNGSSLCVSLLKVVVNDSLSDMLDLLVHSLSQLLGTASNLIHAQRYRAIQYGVCMLVLVIRIEYSDILPRYPSDVGCADIILIVNLKCVKSIQYHQRKETAAKCCGRDTKVVLILRHAANVQASM